MKRKLHIPNMQSGENNFKLLSTGVHTTKGVKKLKDNHAGQALPMIDIEPYPIEINRKISQYAHSYSNQSGIGA
jgi:hypothetical protein